MMRREIVTVLALFAAAASVVLGIIHCYEQTGVIEHVHRIQNAQNQGVVIATETRARVVVLEGKLDMCRGNVEEFKERMLDAEWQLDHLNEWQLVLFSSAKRGRPTGLGGWERKP